MSSKKARAEPLAPEDRRQAIVEAVIPLLVERGASVTTREMAEAAGIAEGTIFRVFPDKCALI
ncbi:MAG TPA: helix-turn-helix domain-containing protein, partial [Acidimicrobiia bacterium]|nr:helix-turn-helix domain-containing protein [Acidimicrobiia bacterium]